MRLLRRVLFFFVHFVLVLFTGVGLFIWVGVDHSPATWNGLHRIGPVEFISIQSAEFCYASADWEPSDSHSWYMDVVSGKLTIGWTRWVERDASRCDLSHAWRGFQYLRRIDPKAIVFAIANRPMPLPMSDAQENRLAFRQSRQQVEQEITTPSWFPALLYGAFPTISLLRFVRRWRKRRRNPTGCINCDYDLTGNASGVCPECGRAIEKSKSQPAKK